MAGCATCLHKNVHPNVCSDCLCGTHYKPRIKTNADRIRAMTEEGLANAIVKTYGEGGICPPNHTHVFCVLDGGCDKCWLDWLKQEVDDV